MLLQRRPRTVNYRDHAVLTSSEEQLFKSLYAEF
jgi:hypothetical protein